MVYLHPYDLDPECPRIFSSMTLGAIPFMFARYYGLARTEKILRELFMTFRFSSIQEWLSAERATQFSATTSSPSA